MESRTYLACGLLVLGMLMPVPAWGHDMVQPPWRGDEGTTYQEWRFDTDANPALPEVISNPYGSALAAIVLGDYASGWQEQLPGLGDQIGYWDLGGDRGNGGGSILIDVDNRPLALEYKEVWVQVTYFRDMSQAPTVTVPGAAYLTGQTLLVEQVLTGGAWYLDQSIWRIEPNPDHEQILITSDPMWGSVIDQVVIDTICIPEPATMGLFLVGSWAVIARRRRAARV